MEAKTAIEIKERPILFSTPMVKAILSGAKTQTRRVVKPMKSQDWLKPETLLKSPSAYPCLINNEQWAQFRHPLAGQFAYGVQHSDDSPLTCIKCPYGKVGDTLYVRETWADVTGAFEDADELRNVAFKADDSVWDCYGQMVYLEKLGDSGIYVDKWKPSIHMPKFASRITLEITNIRVERLQEISEDDAISEGVDSISMLDVPRQATTSRRADFKQLWDKINAKRGYSWESNPFVWVIEFKKL